MEKKFFGDNFWECWNNKVWRYDVKQIGKKKKK